VLEELVACFYPENVLENIAKIIAGVELDNIELVNEEIEADDDNDDDDEDDDAENDDINDDAEDAEGDDVEDNDDEADEEEADTEFDDDEADAEADESSKKKAKIEEKPLLPIQEDPIAHTLLKKILIIQATAERAHGQNTSKGKKTEKKSDKENNKKGEKDTMELDYTNWDNTTNIFNFATLLLDLLNDNGTIENWLQSSDLSPRTNEKLVHKHLIPNIILRSVLDEIDR
jgi:hypothetical protein